MKKKMKPFSSYSDFRKKQSELDQKIAAVEINLSEVKSDIFHDVLPFGFLRKLYKAVPKAPARLGSQALALKLAGHISNPIARVALPLAAGAVSDKLSDVEVQKSMVKGLKRAMNWLSKKTELSIEEEQYLLSEEISFVQDEKASILKSSEKKGLKTAEILEAEFHEAQVIPEEKVQVVIDDANWY